MSLATKLHKYLFFNGYFNQITTFHLFVTDWQKTQKELNKPKHAS